MEAGDVERFGGGHDGAGADTRLAPQSERLIGIGALDGEVGVLEVILTPPGQGLALELQKAGQRRALAPIEGGSVRSSPSVQSGVPGAVVMSGNLAGGPDRILTGPPAEDGPWWRVHSRQI